MVYKLLPDERNHFPPWLQMEMVEYTREIIRDNWAPSSKSILDDFNHFQEFLTGDTPTEARLKALPSESEMVQLYIHCMDTWGTNHPMRSYFNH